MEWLIPMVTGLFILANTAMMWTLNRKSKREDERTQDIKNIDGRIQNVELGQRAILHDRLKYLCRGYIKANQPLQADDHQDLKIMHEAYHQLGGNGTLDLLMAQVERLGIV